MEVLRAADPRRIGPYEVLGRLGAGGMGEVYLAESRSRLRLAVKVVRAEHAEDRTFRARFRHEVRAARTVGGEGTYTARVVDADTEAERPWMATEFVDGPNLRDAVLDGGALPLTAVRVLAGALGGALAAIHGKGMVHRDLKPSNILLAPDGPRVIDFGIVRALEATALTRTGAVVGSVGYVSPEQIRNGGQVGPPSDVFSLGAVLAYAAAGREPFGEGQDSVILLRVLTRDFDLSGVPDGIRPLVEACLREDPLERPTPMEVITAAGHTARSLSEAMRPGWYGTASAARADDSHHWIREAGPGERASGVEYVAPSTPAGTAGGGSAAPSGPAGADTAVPGTAGAESAAPEPDDVVSADPASPARRSADPVAPGRRRLLRFAAGGAVAAAGAGAGGWLWQRASRGAGSGSGPPAAVRRGATGGAGPAVLRWQYDAGTIGGLNGPCVGLSPDGSVVYVGSANGTLHAISRGGARRWRVRLGDDVATPVVTKDGVFCLTWEHDRAVRKLRAVDLTGTPRWERTLGDHGYDLPVLVGDHVLVPVGGTDRGGLRCIAADGSTRWTATTPAGPKGTPLVADGVVYTGSFGDQLLALDASDGSRKWTVPAGTDVDSPVLADGVLIAATAGDRSGFSARDGRRLWKKKAPSEGPLVAAGPSLAVATEAGRVYAVRATDGTTAWSYGLALGGHPWAAASGGTVYVRGDDSVWALGLDGRKRWSTFLGHAAGEDQHLPVVAGHRLYVPSATGIAAADLAS